MIHCHVIHVMNGVCCFLMKIFTLILSSKRNCLANGKWKTLSNSSFTKHPRKPGQPPSSQPFLPEQESSLFCSLLYPQHLALCLTHNRCVWQSLTVFYTSEDSWVFPSSWVVRLAIWLSSGQRNEGRSDVHYLMALKISCAVLYLLSQHTRLEIKASESVQPKMEGAQILETAKSKH